MSYIVVDVEADGEIPYIYSMISFGAVIVDEKLDKTFYGKTRPISNNWKQEFLSISGITREEHENFPNAKITMQEFSNWIKEYNKNDKPIFISDNLAFDWQWINWYFYYFIGYNPFGYSGQRIGDKFQGFFNDPFYKWKIHRNPKYKHNHNPVNDALANASALLYLKNQGYKLFK